MAFTERQLLNALKTTPPGQPLDFSGVSPREVEAAVYKLSGGNGSSKHSARTRDFDLGPHVFMQTHWWGIRIEFDHEAVVAHQEAFTVWNLLLVGVPPIAANIVSGAIGMIAAMDQGNGVIAFVTWAGVHWYLPR